MGLPAVVIDNGACTAKYGLAEEGVEARSMPNCVIKAKNVRSRVFVADQIEECKASAH